MRTIQSRHLPVTGAVRQASRQIWLAGLGAAALTRDWAESGAGPMFRSLVKEGTLVEARTIRAVGDRLESSYTVANSAWRRARAVLQSGVREAAGSAVALVQQRLPRSLPHVTLPVMAAKSPARKAAGTRAAKRGVKATPKAAAKTRNTTRSPRTAKRAK